MSTNTSHYNLTKPAGSENYDVSVQNGNMDKIDAAMWKLLQIRRTLTANDNLDSITENGTAMTGIYYIAANTPSNVPVSGLTWCIMFQIVINETNMIHQYVLKPVAGKIWVREFSGNPSVWTRWKEYAGTAVT